jgi:hypothetical protein
MAHPIRTAAVLATLALATTPAMAQRVVPFHDQGRALAEQLADVLDEDGDGVIDRAELDEFSAAVFASVDRDGDGVMTADELASWRYGMADIATFRGREEAFETTIAFVHDIFDRDNDGRVTATEHVAAIAHSATYADLDGDGVLTRDEYLDGFVFNVAMRNALVPRRGEP